MKIEVGKKYYDKSYNVKLVVYIDNIEHGVFNILCIDNSRFTHWHAEKELVEEYHEPIKRIEGWLTYDVDAIPKKTGLDIITGLNTRNHFITERPKENSLFSVIYCRFTFEQLPEPTE